MNIKCLCIILFCIGILSKCDDFINGWNGYNNFSDDAYYYIVTAKNYVDFDSFTFDGINETNGFHPLWMIVNILVFKIIGTNSPLEFQIFVIKAIEIVIFLLALMLSCIFYIKLYNRNNIFSYGFLGITVVLIYPSLSGERFIVGMETTIAMLFMIISLYCFLTDKIFLLSIFLPFLFLSRIDTFVFIITPMLAFFMLQRKYNFKNKFILLLPITIIFLAFLIYNTVYYGHFMPISGALKSSFPNITTHFSFYIDPVINAFSSGKFYQLMAPNLFTLTLLLAISIILSRFILPLRYNPYRLVVVGIIPLLLLLNFGLFQKWNKAVTVWYLVLPQICVFFFFFTVIGNYAKQHGLKIYFKSMILFVLLIFFVCYIYQFIYNINKGFICPDIIKFIKKNTKQTDIFAATDCGYPSFWTQRRIINLDGIINNYEYQLALKRKCLKNYLLSKNVRYLLVGIWADKQRYFFRDDEYMYHSRVNRMAVYSKAYSHFDFYVYSYLYNTFSDKLVLYPEQEIYRGRIHKDGRTDCVTVLYDLNKQ